MNLGDRRLLELLDRRSLEENVSTGCTVLIGVSGGADSVALLRALSVYAPSLNIELAAVHVNHGLRPEAEQEGVFVQETCAQAGVELFTRKLQLEQKPKGRSPEEFWREQRYAVFAQVLDETNADFLALGHTADDLAETFLYHLARGTGPEGLMFRFLNDADDFPIVRPLWKTRRADIERALNGVDQAWVDDPSNLDFSFSRNRIRGQVIPALEKINPSVVTAIVNLSDQLTELAAHSDELIDVDDKELELEPLRILPRPLVRDALKRFIYANADVLPGSRHLDQAADMIADGKSGLVALPESWTLVLTQTGAWVYGGANPDNSELAAEHMRDFGGFAADLTGKSCALVHGHATIEALDYQGYDIHMEGAPGDYCIRNRRPGDRVGQRSLKKLLIDFMIPWYMRDFLVLAATPEGQVVAIISNNAALDGWVRNHALAIAELSYTIVHPSV